MGNFRSHRGALQRNLQSAAGCADGQMSGLPPQRAGAHRAACIRALPPSLAVTLAPVGLHGARVVAAAGRFSDRLMLCISFVSHLFGCQSGDRRGWICNRVSRCILGVRSTCGGRLDNPGGRQNEWKTILAQTVEALLGGPISALIDHRRCETVQFSNFRIFITIPSNQVIT